MKKKQKKQTFLRCQMQLNKKRKYKKGKKETSYKITNLTKKKLKNLKVKKKLQTSKRTLVFLENINARQTGAITSTSGIRMKKEQVT